MHRKEKTVVEKWYPVKWCSEHGSVSKNNEAKFCFYTWKGHREWNRVKIRCVLWVLQRKTEISSLRCHRKMKTLWSEVNLLLMKNNHMKRLSNSDDTGSKWESWYEWCRRNKQVPTQERWTDCYGLKPAERQQGCEVRRVQQVLPHSAKWFMSMREQQNVETRSEPILRWTQDFVDFWLIVAV